MNCMNQRDIVGVTVGNRVALGFDAMAMIMAQEYDSLLDRESAKAIVEGTSQKAIMRVDETPTLFFINEGKPVIETGSMFGRLKYKRKQ